MLGHKGNFKLSSLSQSGSPEETFKGILSDSSRLIATYVVIVTGGILYDTLFPWESVSAMIVIIFNLWMPIYQRIYTTDKNTTTQEKNIYRNKKEDNNTCKTEPR